MIQPGISAGMQSIKDGAVREAVAHESVSKALDSSFRQPDLVKGVGYVTGNKPIDDYGEIIERLGSAQDALAKASWEGYHKPAEVTKAISPQFGQIFRAAFMNGPNGGVAPWMGEITNAVQQMAAEMGKNFSLTSPLASGFVPFNLLAPSRLIYPFFSPMRNKLQRTPGQGESIRAKLVVGIQGSQTGGSAGNPKFMFMSEFPGGGSFSTWPNQLPAAGSQAAQDLNIPYSFQGISESVSWPAQFSSQGYEDLAGLANLILLQEAMLAEEYQILASTATTLTTPGTPTLVARTAGSNETALSGVTTNVFVKVTFTNFTGETVASTGGSVAWSAGQVVDVTVITPPLAGLSANLYVTTGASAGTYHLMASGVGGTRFTLQGALPTTGPTPPTADTGTGQANAYEGMFSVSSGWAATNNVYPSGFLGSYVNKSVGTTLSIDVVNTALTAMWDGGTTATGFGGATYTTSGGFRANPAEVVAEGSDVANLSASIIKSGSSNNYLLAINQGEVARVTGGVAVESLVNPVTRDVVKILVHPWMPQGNALINSYTMSNPWTNVSNVWEVNNVQDYLSISWPVIDMTFRYSLALLGTVVCYSPQYNGVLGGLQRNASTPYS